MAKEPTVKTVKSEPTERDLLLDQAKLLGLEHRGNISTEDLRGLIFDKLNGRTDPVAGHSLETKHSSVPTSRGAMRDKALSLVRVRVSCHNPDKLQLPGEVKTVANGVIGKVSKYIPFGPKFYEHGYHIESCLVDLLKECTYNARVPVTTGNADTIKLVPSKEFSVEVLPPLTAEELDALAKRQTATGSLSADE